MITLQGLTKRQVIIAECLWNHCETQRDVEAVLANYGKDARTVYELLTAASMDQIQDTDLAEIVIDNIKNR